MDTNIKENLRKQIGEMRNILFTAQSSFKILDYLYRTRSENDYTIINGSLFLKFTASTHWRIYVIEMSKLFSNRRTEHFNIHQLIGKFKPGGEFHCEMIPNNSIKIWEDNLVLKHETALIDNLISQRDKLYSHTDKDREDIKNALSFIDSMELMNIVKRMLSEIYITVFDVTMVMEPLNEPADDLKRLIRMLETEAKVLADLEKKAGG